MPVYTLLLRVHVVFGAIALLAGVGALCLAKGSPWHRRVGIAFVLSMLGMGVTGIALAVIDPNLLNVVIGVFAIYLAATGWRAARRADAGAGAFEWASLAFVHPDTIRRPSSRSWSRSEPSIFA